MRFIVINGPNLNKLGTREPEIYGTDTLHDLEGAWRRHGAAMGIGVDSYQSNHEGALIDHIQDAGDRYDGMIINPAAYSHYSYAIHDALAAIAAPVVEVHISNIHEREPWRAHSVVSPAAIHTIYGRGTRGYLDAIDHLWARLHRPPEVIRYGDEVDQFVELRTVLDARGTAVLLHGGFWRRHWHRDLMDRMAIALLDTGWTTANVEYRRGTGSYATADSDVGAAVDAIAGNGGPVITIGHSAGGYLALRSTEHDAVTRAIGLAPVLDLVGISDLRPDDDPIAAFIGASRADAPESWDAAAITPSHVDSATVIHGTHDEPVPFEHSRAFAERHGVDLVTLEGADHMSLIDPASAAFGAVLDALNGTADTD